jgi:hypothetical protein
LSAAAEVLEAVLEVLASELVPLPGRLGMMRGAAGAKRMLPTTGGFEPVLSHRVVAGDMLCLALWEWTGWKAEWW